MRWQLTAFEGYLSETPLLMALWGLMIGLLFSVLPFSADGSLVIKVLVSLALCIFFPAMGIGIALLGGIKNWDCVMTDTGVEIKAWHYNPLSVYTWLGPVLGILLVGGVLRLELPFIPTMLAVLSGGISATLPFFPVQLKPFIQRVSFASLAHVFYDPRKKAMRFVLMEGYPGFAMLPCPAEHFEEVLHNVKQAIGDTPFEQGSIQQFRPMQKLWHKLSSAFSDPLSLLRLKR